jgi:hypothetical protein
MRISTIVLNWKTLLWLRHLVESEEASRECVRVWTSFENLLGNWEATVESIALGLGIVWPNGPDKVAGEVANILRLRHRHYRITDDTIPVPLGPLTIRAWQAAQHGLSCDALLNDGIRETEVFHSGILRTAGFDYAKRQDRADRGEFLDVPTGGGNMRGDSFYGEAMITRRRLELVAKGLGFSVCSFDDESPMPQSYVVLQRE